MEAFDEISDLVGVITLNKIVTHATYHNVNILHKGLTKDLITKLGEDNSIRNFSLAEMKKSIRCLSRIDDIDFGKIQGV